MKLPKTKQEIREELEREMSAYLQRGGVVKDIPRGLSGNVNNQNLFGQYGEHEPRKSRTPVDDVVRALEERKKPDAKPAPKASRGPRRKLITDDFGEPVRWIWVDDE